MREVTRFGPWSDLLRAVGQTYFMQYARKHLATPTVGDLNFVYTPQGTPSDPQSITFTGYSLTYHKVIQSDTK